jgi:hypothetical protein
VVVIRTIQSLRRRDAPPIPDLMAQVVEQGPVVIEFLLEVLTQGVVPALDREEPQILSIYQEELVLTSLESFGRELVFPLIEDRFETSDRRELAGAVRALGAVGTSRDLDLILDLRFEREIALEPWLSDALQEGMTGILRRDRDAPGFLTLRWRNADPALLAPMVAALGDAGDARGVEILGDVIVWHADLASNAVGQLRRLGPHPLPGVNAAIASNLRPQLDTWSSSPGHLRAVILALGELQDFQSVPMLLDLLQEESSGLRQNTIWSLQRMTGLHLGEDPEFWSAWYESEREWFMDERPRLRSYLSLSDPAKVTSALREYSTHRLFRHDLAQDLAVVLWREESHLRILTCGVLAQLESNQPVPDLIALLEDADDEVNGAALSALQAITGLDLPGDPEAWRDAVGLDY